MEAQADLECGARKLPYHAITHLPQLPCCRRLPSKRSFFFFKRLVFLGFGRLSAPAPFVKKNSNSPVWIGHHCRDTAEVFLMI